MKIIPTSIPDVLLIEPRVFKDPRGYFFESFNEAAFHKAVPGVQFIQDNEAFSQRGTLRGLHFQAPPYAQAKLVRVVQGRVLDVAVDMRKRSPTFGQHVDMELSGENKRQLYVPRGFAHGYVVLSETAVFAYKVDHVYHKASEQGVIFNDPALAIHWPIDADQLLLSDKDKVLPQFKDAVYFD